jgi:hypothetical protein
MYTIPADKYGLVQNTMVFAHDVQPSTGVVSGNIMHGGHYIVRGTGTVTYNAVVYNVGDTFVGVGGGVVTYTTTGSPIVKACIRIKNYDKFAGGQSYKIIELNDEFFDYKSMASHCYLRGYWREETYRIGAMAWDLFGNPYAVRFLGDITMPSQSAGYPLINNNDPYFSLNALGIKIDDLDITEIKDMISGISIVRVPRDAQILAQGCKLLKRTEKRMLPSRSVRLKLMSIIMLLPTVELLVIPGRCSGLNLILPYQHLILSCRLEIN